MNEEIRKKFKDALFEYFFAVEDRIFKSKNIGGFNLDEIKSKEEYFFHLIKNRLPINGINIEIKCDITDLEALDWNASMLDYNGKTINLNVEKLGTSWKYRRRVADYVYIKVGKFLFPLSWTNLQDIYCEEMNENSSMFEDVVYG